MQTENSEIREMLDRQNQLIEDNNRLLHKIHRYEMMGFWVKVLWYAVLIGGPIFVYYYFVEPHAENIMNSYKAFSATFYQIPGLNEFIETYKASQNRN